MTSTRSLARAALVAATLTLSIAPIAIPSTASAQAPAGTATATAAPQNGAQPAAETPPKKALPPGFERVAGKAEEEKLNPTPLVAGAYAMFFVVMFGYLIFVARGQTAISKEMAELAERIRKAEKS